MWYELYAREKIRELEDELAHRYSYQQVVRSPGSPPAAALLRGAGRALRRLGEGLEAWGSSRSSGASDGEAAW